MLIVQKLYRDKRIDFLSTPKVSKVQTECSSLLPSHLEKEESPDMHFLIKICLINADRIFEYLCENTLYQN